MQYTAVVDSPLGEMLLAGDESGLTGLWFAGQKYFGAGLQPGAARAEAAEIPALAAARRWLDVYFSGREPDFLPPLHLVGTPFRVCVWRQLLKIPYGETITYGALAARVARAQGLPRMSAQAVGGAVGHNPISVIVPCHRVVGADGSLTGYAGGVDRKAKLLEMEGADRTRLYIPDRGTAL